MSQNDKNAFDQICDEIKEELDRARIEYPERGTYHHMESVIREEYTELWDEVRKKPKDRDKDNMRRECVQIAANAVRFIQDLL